MRRILLPFLFIPYLIPVHAQVIERNIQTNWQSDLHGVVRWNDSTSAFIGNANYLSTPLSAGLVMAMDTAGGERWRLPVITYGNEGTYFNALAAQNDSVLVIAGYTQEVCDVASVQGLLLGRNLSGDSLWQRDYVLQPLQTLATPTGHILAGSNDQVLVLDALGDSLDQITLPLGAIGRMRTDGDHALLSCANGALIVDAIGTVLAARSDTDAVLDFIRYTDTSYAYITESWLYRLDDTLATIDSTTYVPLGSGVSLHEELAFLWLVGNDTLRFLDDSLHQSIAFPTNAPAGHSASDALLTADAILTAGRFDDHGIRTGVVRGVGKHGETFTTDEDAHLGEVSADTVFWNDLGGGYYTATAVLRAWVRNDGSALLNDAYLTVFNGYSFCGPVGVINNTGLSLAPGDSILAYIGGITTSVYSPDTLPVDVEFCVNVTGPDAFMDRDTTDDRSCGIITIPIGTDGIHEMWRMHGPLIFPNPVRDRLNVAMEGPPTGTMPYEVRTLNGSLAMRGTVNGRSIAIDTSTLASGSYTLHVFRSDGVRTGRFMRLP